MIKALPKLLIIGLVLSLKVQICLSQSPEVDYETCPVTSYINYFDTTSVSFLHAPEEIQLGQARVLMKDPARCTFVQGIDLYIPTNRPGWAIGLAHTHRIMTNFMGADVFNINYLHGAAFQESTYKNGSGGETWPAVADHNVASDLVLGCGFAINHADGYFHTDANGRIFISDMYGTRFPTNGSSANLTASFEQNIHLAMMWVNAFYRVNQFGRQLKMKSFFIDAADPFASTKLTAGAYVAGQLIADIESVVETNRATTINAPDILPYITTGSAHNYATSVSGYTEALSTPSDIVKPAFESTQHSWYDHQITWQDVSDYLDQMEDVYVEVDIPTIKTYVKSVFDGINNGGSVSFRYEFSPVIDAITGSFPYYEPEILATQQAIYKCNYDCVLPYPTISYNTPLSFCNGLSVELTTIVGDYTYQWYKDNLLIAGAEEINYFASESGIYSVVITDPNDCSLETNTKVEVNVTECSSCAMAVQANANDVTCSGYGDGDIAVIASGVSGPFTYQLDSNPPQSSASFIGLTEGNYFIEVVQTSDPTCKGFASATIDAETIITNTIVLDTTSIDCEMTSLAATVIDLPPSQCTYKFIREGSNEWGAWPYQEVKVALMDGDNELYNTRTLESSPISTVPQRAFEVEVSVPNGANLSIVVTNASSSGTSISDSWWYKIEAPDGEVIANVTSPGTYQSGKTTILAPIEAICKFDRPDFNFEWSPSNVLSNLTDTTATATVESTTLVKITATNPNDPACPLKDSVFLSNTCNGNICVPATQAQISSSGGVNEVCSGNNLSLSLDTDQPGYNIQWALDGIDLNGATSTSFLATESGTYTVQVSDPSDPGCTYESSTSEEFNLTVTASVSPTIVIESDATTICSGQEVDFSIQSVGNEGITPTYEWFINNDSQTSGQTFSSTALIDGDEVTAVLTSSLECIDMPNTTSNVIEITVASDLEASITISADLTEICEGDVINFALDDVTNEGFSPSYEWFVNGESQSTAVSFSSQTLEHGDRITCEMNSSDACVSTPLVVSDEIVVTVNSNQTPTVAIMSSAQEICSGDEVSFSITDQTHEGSSPSYSWLINGIPNSSNPTLSSSTLQDGDEITLSLISSETCVTNETVQSAGIIINVSSSVTPSLTIEATSSTDICTDETLEFRILEGNGLGNGPTYEWYVNSIKESTIPSETISLSGFADGDKVTAIASGLSSCASSPTVTSNEITVSIISPVTPMVEIEADQETACFGDMITFDIKNSSNSGANPSYQWLLNDLPVSGATSSSYQSNSFSTSDEVKLQLTVQEICVTTSQVISTPIQLSITPIETPTVEIEATTQSICPGGQIDFTITAISGEGASPMYDWMINDTNEGSGNSFSSSQLADNDKVKLILTSSLSCVSSPSITSNEIEITVLGDDPGLTLTASKNPICQNEEVNFEANVNSSASIVYSWFVNDISEIGSTNQYSSNSLTNGDIVKVEAEINSTCGVITRSQEIVMMVEERPTPIFIPEELEACSGDGPVELQVLGVTSGQMNWTKNGESISGATSETLSTNESGEYGILFTSVVCGQSSFEGSQVLVTQTPEVDAGSDLSIAEGEMIQLQGEVSDGTQVNWLPAIYMDNNMIIDPVISTTEDFDESEIVFTVQATNGNCSATDEMVLTIYKEFKVLSAFSPNGDGINDVWNLTWMAQYPTASLKIFNRWGDQIFESIGYPEPWDGTRNKKAVPVGTYYYVIDLDNAESLNGSVTIIK